MAKPTRAQRNRAQQKRRKAPEGAPRTRQPRVRASRQQARRMIFTRQNYLLMLLGIGLVVAGYVMMYVDGQVESFISLYLAPLLILGGYLEIIYAILWRPKEAPAETETAS